MFLSRNQFTQHLLLHLRFLQIIIFGVTVCFLVILYHNIYGVPVESSIGWSFTFLLSPYYNLVTSAPPLFTTSNYKLNTYHNIYYTSNFHVAQQMFDKMLDPKFLIFIRVIIQGDVCNTNSYCTDEEENHGGPTIVNAQQWMWWCSLCLYVVLRFLKIRNMLLKHRHTRIMVISIQVRLIHLLIDSSFVSID